MDPKNLERVDEELEKQQFRFIVLTKRKLMTRNGFRQTPDGNWYDEWQRVIPVNFYRKLGVEELETYLKGMKGEEFNAI